MKARFTSICLLGVTVACTGPSQQRRQTQTSPQAQETRAQTPEPKQPGSDFEISVAAIDCVKEWQPKSEKGAGRMPTGVSLITFDGGLFGFRSAPGFELAVVRLNVKRLVYDAKVPLEAVSVEDEKGQKYDSVMIQLDALGLRQSANEKREFAFGVPKGAALKTIHLTEGLSVELK